MKRLLISLSVFAIVELSGCGGSGSSESINLDATVNYKTSGTYDLKNYIVPEVNSINTYRELTYTNEDGKKSFKGDPDEVINAEKYDVQGDTIIVRDGTDAIDEVYTIRADKIEQKDDLNSTTSETIARFVDVGDYILVTKSNVGSSNGIPIQKSIACKITKHYSNKELDNKNYSDVLQIECKTNGSGTTNANNIAIAYNDEETGTVYIAKNIGEVFSESVDCEKVTTTIGGKDTTNATCEKEIRSLISSNKL